MPVFNVADNGDNLTLRRAIFAATPEAVRQTKKLAKEFCTGNDMGTAKKIWQFLKTQIHYQADGYHQKIKLPSALLRDRVGDCKSYSLFTAGILENCGIPWHYMLASYNSDPTPSHIYVMTDSGIIIDAVWTAFNQEKQPVYSYKQKTNDMRISKITGLGAVSSKSIGYTSRTCGCQTKVGSCGCNKIGAISPKRVLNSPARQLVLGMVSTNIGGMATLFSHIPLETLRREWTKFGGDGASIARALNDGINKPIKAKWFYDKLTKLVNASFKDYMKKVGAKGIKGSDGEPSTSPPDWILGEAGTFSTSGSFDVPNDQPKGGNFSVSAEDLVAFMSTSDSEQRVKQVIEWGAAGLSSLICNDPTGATKVVCGAIGKEQVGDIIYTFWSWIKFGLAQIFANANSPQFSPLTQAQCNEFVKRWKDKIGQQGQVQAFDPSQGGGVVVDMGEKYKSTTPDQTITWTKQESETIIRNMYFHTTPESKKFIAEACKQYGLCPDLVALHAPQDAGVTQAGFGGWIAVGAIALLALGAMNKKR